MIAVWKREMAQYFKTPMGYLFLGMFTLLCGLMFAFYGIRASGGASVYVLLSGMRLPFMLIAPLLTMRLMAEERRSHTDQLLLTSPLSVAQIVLGKALAAYTVLLASLILTLYFPLLVSPYAAVDPGTAAAAEIGFFFMNLCTLSVGVLMSSLCVSQVSAGVLTLGVNMLMYLLETYVLPQLGASYLAGAYAVLSRLSLSARYATFQNGVVGLSEIVYFLSFSGFMLLLSGLAVSRRRWAKG
jgi:ABC-2 type transport system permease protein